MNTRFHEKIVFKGNSLIFPHKLNFRLRAENICPARIRRSVREFFLTFRNLNFVLGRAKRELRSLYPPRKKYTVVYKNLVFREYLTNDSDFGLLIRESTLWVIFHHFGSNESNFESIA